MHVSGQGGYTLIELMLVVSLLALIAAIAVPSRSSNTAKTLDLSAAEIAKAMRFARSESMRTGVPFGFRLDAGAEQIRVFRLDTGATPPSPVYDVYHPVTRQLYDIRLDSGPFTAADSLVATSVYRGTCNAPENIYFDGTGAPFCANPAATLLDSLDVDITLGTGRRTVTLDRVTGRATVQ